MTRTRLFTLLGLAAITGIAWFTVDRMPDDEPMARQLAELTTQHPPAATDELSAVVAATPAPAGFVDTLARRMAAEFGPLIDDVAIQARLYQIRQAVIQRFPEQGSDYFRQALHQAFPEHAEAIMALIAKLDQYHEWLLAQNRTLMELPPLESAGMLWQKRHELFGDQAEIIWAEERQELDGKRLAFQQKLKELNDTETGTLEEKLFQLKNSLAETFDGPMQQLVDNRGLISQVFFSLDSVQTRLETLTPEERQTQIDEVRRQLGFSEAQIQNLRAQDSDRNRRWETGKAYMAERERIVAQTQGPAQNEALEQLRNQYFGREAHTIRLEEESGFFRFERPRVYGRN